MSAGLTLALLSSAVSVAFEDTGGGVLFQLPGLLIPLGLGMLLLGPSFLEVRAWRRSPASGLVLILFLVSAAISAFLAALKFYDPYTLFFDVGIVLGFIVWSGVWGFPEESVWHALKAYCLLSTAGAVGVLTAMGHLGARFETFLHPNLWGLFCFTNFCLAGLFKSSLLRVLLQVGNIIVILAAQSRSSLLSTMVAAALLVFFAVRSAKIRPEDKLLAMIVAVSACSMIFFLLRDQLSTLFSQAFLLDDPFRGSTSGFTGRTELWQSGLRMIESNPLFGVGPRMEGNYMPGGLQYAHSGYISTVAQYGVIGGGLFFAFVFMRGRKLWQMAEYLRPGASVGAAFVGSYAIEAIFEPKLLSIGNPASLLLLAFLFLPGANTRGTTKLRSITRADGLFPLRKPLSSRVHFEVYKSTTTIE